MSSIADVNGIKLGHASDAKGITGFTVVLCEDGAAGSVAVFGGAPGTRETDLLRPSFTVGRVHSVFLSGGSAFGLNAAEGVVRYLEEKNIGFDTQIAKIPIVAGAVIFDLGIGDPKSRPTPEMAYQACLDAGHYHSESGNIGAGMGATVGKLFGPHYMMKSGLGNSSLKLSDGYTVGCVIVANAAGDVFNPETGRPVAGAYDGMKKRFLSLVSPTSGASVSNCGPGDLVGRNTTIGVVATDAELTKDECRRVAIMAMGGLARAIRPSFTPFDGDTIFVLSTGRVHALQNNGPGSEFRAELVAQIGIAAQEAVVKAVLDAVTSCKGIAGIPAMADIES
ncbi:MAG: P1 family peptidase [Bacillota bacterium]|jgi:L-aminopeptidase/D-esterase-like protein